MKKTGMAVLPGITPRIANGGRIRLPERKFSLVIETDGPARVEVSGSGADMYQPERAVMDDNKNWRDKPEAGYYPGSFHLHRNGDSEIAPRPIHGHCGEGPRVQSNRINSGFAGGSDGASRAPKMGSHGVRKDGGREIFTSIANPRLPSYSSGLRISTWAFSLPCGTNRISGRTKACRADPVVRADSEHIATLMNEEDERGGGAWMMHNLKKPIDLSGADRWYPQGQVFIDQAKSQGGWFDSEKPIWWEAPVMAALVGIDSMGVVHNHYYQYGMMANEAWGRPRDQKLYPGNGRLLELFPELVSPLPKPR